MKTKLKSVHNEERSDNSETIGVVLNHSLENDGWQDSLIFVFNHKRLMYTFFNTIVDMVDFHLYGAGSKVKTARMNEEEYDAYYDAEFIDGKFNDKLTWL
jgi:hypothetical protein